MELETVGAVLDYFLKMCHVNQILEGNKGKGRRQMCVDLHK